MFVFRLSASGKGFHRAGLGGFAPLGEEVDGLGTRGRGRRAPWTRWATLQTWVWYSSTGTGLVERGTGTSSSFNLPHW
jgi:hypothetical protein